MSLVRSKAFDYVLLAMFGVYATVALTSPPGYGLTVFGNLAQALFQGLAVYTLLLNVGPAGGHRRAFWYCLAAGGALWLMGQCSWIYYEVFQKTEVPDPYFADVLFFLHTVPLIAAATLQPHADFAGGGRRRRFGYLDFGMLLVWWIFIYGYVVGPWQFVVPDVKAFGQSFNVLYLIENLLVILAFAVLAWRTRYSWRWIYGALFLTHLVYTLSSFVINMGIDRKLYYTGGVFDIPLITSLLLQAYVGARAYRAPLRAEAPLVSEETQALWHGRFAAVAVVTMPFLVFFDALSPAMPDEVQHFRLLLTLASMLAMMLLLFVKQHLLDSQLRSLLQEARESFDNLQRLQGQLVQTEKLASIGRLVAGAAHEINNPLTAIMGYSDLLAEDRKLPPDQLEMAQKIRQQARRIKQLVQNFLTFAKQPPGGSQRATVDMCAIVTGALQLHDLDQQIATIDRKLELSSGPVLVDGDENHLMQMCLHMFNNAAEAMAEAHGRGTLTISLGAAEGQAVLEVRDTGPGVADPGRIFDPFYTTKAPGKGTGLGLSACYGIVREHGGFISCQNLPEGGALFQVSLPLSPVAVPAAP